MKNCDLGQPVHTPYEMRYHRWSRFLSWPYTYIVQGSTLISSKEYTLSLFYIWDNVLRMYMCSCWLPVNRIRSWGLGDWKILFFCRVMSREERLCEFTIFITLFQMYGDVRLLDCFIIKLSILIPNEWLTGTIKLVKEPKTESRKRTWGDGEGEHPECQNAYSIFYLVTP